MTENMSKVLSCLTEKRLADMQNGSVNCGWMTIRNITIQCGFEKNNTTTGCVIALMNKEIVEMSEDTTLDGKSHRYYRIRNDANLTITYSFKNDIVAKRNIVWQSFDFT